ncbi:glutamate 5-kinase [Alkaliphilus metalliredigens QYMF]|uniref:Glutamate 5-kinase n=1 Tax=Alkaliphilus metalliredigens (strain QYMF) TaxID=293826 RepID=PROB_ALKMQ|nr:glutamate 5-kinase [Alkaliphilus metalliredigens]A6TU99.1 RecName: Full=Glutamate 5-kinase; AltName: Full=Gamma-glutamyl kinase; Short=GK [Alkaliphilus metalliredigens QYMF]ABR49767.1 glutamate 5-kinase [Alkaliphilus metalliredigens QYMF]
MIEELINKSKKIVIKIGSNTLSNDNGTINKNFLKELSEQIIYLRDKGKQFVIVSSGARIAGVSTLGKWMRKEDMNYKQALCAIGQVELMDAYRRCFEPYNVFIAQMLLTRDDFSDAHRRLNIRNTLFTLVDEGVIPIINENDTVSVEEIRIGDNDTLAALTTNIWNADLLILFSDIDGIYDKNPKEHEDAILVENVMNIDELLEKIEVGDVNEFGTGGIATKIEAAKAVNDYGIPMILANGKKENILLKLLEGTEKATIFQAGK